MEENKELTTEYTVATLMQECSHALKETYLGTIKQIAKAADYATSKKRVFILDWHDNVVFMHEDDAPEEITKLKKASAIVGTPIPFKAKKYDHKTKQMFVSFKEICDSYTRLCDKKIMLKGTISKVEEDGLKIECLGDILYMPNEEYYYIKRVVSPNMVGKKIYFHIKQVEGNNVIATRLELLEKERDEIIEELQGGKAIQAVVTDVRSWGVRLLYKGHVLLMRDKDFSLDFTKTSRVFKSGDKVDVKLNEVSFTKRIFVEPLEKYNANKDVDVTKYEVGDVILGEVVTVATMGVFVNLEPGIDALCPIPNPLYNREPVAGESVMVRISKVLPEMNKLRGKIVSYVKDSNDNDLAIVPEEAEA